MFEEPIKDITLPNDITEWLKEGLKECNKDVSLLQENRLASLQIQYERTNNRLNRLFDIRMDKEIDRADFKAKES